MTMMQLVVCWYDRRPDFTPNYTEYHHGSFFGKTPEEIMTQLRAFQETHDLMKYTALEIVGIY